jgi:hypothetical protein
VNAKQYLLARSKLPQTGVYTLKEHFLSMDGVNYSTPIGKTVVNTKPTADVVITPVTSVLPVVPVKWTLNVKTRILPIKVNLVTPIKIVISVDN